MQRGVAQQLAAPVTGGGTAGRVTAAHSDTEQRIQVAAIVMAAHR